MMKTKILKSSVKPNQGGIRVIVLACITALSSVCGSSTFAQLKLEPLQRDASTGASKKKTYATARTASDPLLLPFFDDFSSTPIHDATDPTAGFPSEDRWERSSSVWVNEGLGINPPSVNVATLDGLTGAGIRYSEQVLDNGFRDTLMSRPIDMSTDHVAPGERSSVYLSFFYQWQGNGEPPDASDFFRIEFLDADGEWNIIETITTQPTHVRDEFIQMIIPVSDEKYFHEQFQFRFRNYGRLAGPYDTWNLDYIYLDKGRNANDLTYLDRAIASRIGPVFNGYYSIPIDHFRAAPLYAAPQVDIQNLRGGPDGAPTDYEVLFTFDNYSDGSADRITMPFGPVGSKYPDNNLQPGERFRSTIRTTSSGIDIGDPSFNHEDYFLPTADSIKLKIALNIYEPDLGDFAANDTISQVYVLDDYYAYDDGTAEYAVVLLQPDDQVAYGFDVIAPGPQQLVGFDVYIPPYSISGYTTAEFFVMDADENGEPNERLTTTTHVARKTARDGFQRVVIEPVTVEGQFFIGWKGSFSTKIRIGVDYSNNTVQRVFEDLNGVMENGKVKWFPVNSLSEGSLMIRPNFGEPGPISGIRPEKKTIAVYPNPSRGTFYVDGTIIDIEITSVSGQMIPYTAEPEGDRTRISIPEPVQGLYIMQVRKPEGVFTSKIVVH